MPVFNRYYQKLPLRTLLVSQLFSEFLRRVGRNPNGGGKKKGYINVHAMMDAFSGVTEFVQMTEDGEDDRNPVSPQTGS